MTAPVSTIGPLADWEYELLAGADTAEGDRAWNAGNYPRAIRHWLSAARWQQFARRADGAIQ